MFKFITWKDEIRQVLLRVGQLTPEEIDEMIKHYDTDNDGKINFDEYLDLMMSKNSA